jgi:predicted nucleic acid-binding protein
MARALFDTNILNDHLRGIPAARAEPGRYDDKAVSIISWMEVLAGAPPAAEPVKETASVTVAAMSSAPAFAGVTKISRG